MKKILLTLLLVTASTMAVTSQNIARDFFKKRAANDNEADSTIVVPHTEDSIPYIAPMEKTQSKIVNNVDSASIVKIMNNLFILRQDYCLKNKLIGKVYGMDEKEQFGSSYSIAIKCKGYNIITDEAVSPWNYDKQYESYKSMFRKPVLTRSFYMKASDPTQDYIVLDSIVTANRVIREGSLYASNPILSNQDGFNVNNADTCKNGILVWIIKESNEWTSNALKTVQVPFQVEMFGTRNVSSPKDAVAGLFLVASGANKEYELAGLAIQNSTGWALTFPFKRMEEEKPATPESQGKLTEIKKSGKK